MDVGGIHGAVVRLNNQLKCFFNLSRSLPNVAYSKLVF